MSVLELSLPYCDSDCLPLWVWSWLKRPWLESTAGSGVDPFTESLNLSLGFVGNIPEGRLVRGPVGVWDSSYLG